MASLLRQIVASPRVRHPEADLDLCYVTDKIIATSGPSGTYPQVAYRNPLKDLVKFLDAKHGDKWSIWEFRAEGTGYGDDEVYGRIRHYPWPDHHPPPFTLVPLIMASMRNWLNEQDGRVVVVHCKAGKGRSGTVACSYLISEEGWTPEEAMQRFSDRRMRPGFGVGISIPSQRRTISYVDRWTKHGKVYVERPAEVVELHVWGLRDGVKIAIEGYVEEGKVIKIFHAFNKSEREIVRGSIRKDAGFAEVAMEAMGKNKKPKPDGGGSIGASPVKAQFSDDVDGSGIDRTSSDLLTEGGDVIFRPSSRILLPSGDINVDFERRNKSKYGGFTMVTSVAHVWFNTFFEGNGPEQNGRANGSGVFEIEWDAMDGIKGSSRKGTRAFDRMAVVWKAADAGGATVIEPGVGEEVKQMLSAQEWKQDEQSRDSEKKLGLRKPTDASAAVSQASSMQDLSQKGSDEEVPDEIDGVRSYKSNDGADTRAAALSPTERAANDDKSMPGDIGHLAVGVDNLSTSDVPDGRPGPEAEYDHTSALGSVHKAWKDQHTVS